MQNGGEHYSLYEKNLAYISVSKEIEQRALDLCLRSLNPGHRRFGTATDNEIKACLARYFTSL